MLLTLFLSRETSHNALSTELPKLERNNHEDLHFYLLKVLNLWDMHNESGLLVAIFPVLALTSKLSTANRGFKAFSRCMLSSFKKTIIIHVRGRDSDIEQEPVHQCTFQMPALVTTAELNLEA